MFRDILILLLLILIAREEIASCRVSIEDKRARERDFMCISICVCLLSRLCVVGNWCVKRECNLGLLVAKNIIMRVKV